MGKFIDLTGKKISKWNVIQRVYKKKNITHWLCKCECGVHSFVIACHLLGGKSTKCKTCHNKEAVKNRPLKHGHAIRNISRKEYSSWNSMKNRCRNLHDDHWKNYGGRGITFCDSWNNFETFFKDMGKCPLNHTLDRIDVNGNYSPENCRWASHKTQCENKRNNVFFEIKGIRKTKTQWAREYGIPYTSFSRLIKKHGWPLPNDFIK
jgi:hypothetical protein